jgi:arginyl-tRNA synthetase
MKEIVVDFLSKELKLKKEEVEDLVEVPPQLEFGDYAFPCFSLAKQMKKSPLLIAEELVEKFRKKLPKEISGVDVKSAYVNFFMDKKVLAEKVLKGVDVKKDKKEKIIIDYSHPNVAKHFAVHNLRSTLIGHSLYLILKACGANVISINHLGDWGTQFGKLIVAYKKWGKNVKSIEDLNKIYIKFHDEAEKDNVLEDMAREEFKKLEDGNAENMQLWKKFYNLSMKEFEEVYKILGIEFDETKGESCFTDIGEVRKKLEKKGLLEKSEGANVVKISGERPPLIFEKTDGASTYHSRDLVAILYRLKKKPDRILYIVDIAQKLHFEQVFEVAGKLGIKGLEHIEFGRLKFKDGQMSTRKGNVILFEDLLRKLEDKALKMIEQRSPSLKGKKEASRKVALAAVIFNDLKQDRRNNIVFDWDEALRSEGRTGPYLLYSYARANSILRKVKSKKAVKVYDLKDEEILLLKKIEEFPEIVKKSYEQLAPNLIANYSYELAKIFNEFYHECPVLGSKEEGFRLKLCDVFAKTLKKSLGLLGIDVLDEM